MYYKFFGLNDAPFKFQASDTLFLSRSHSEALAALERALQEPSGLTLLVGEAGAGKTMLINSLISHINDDAIRIAQLNDPTLNFEQMLRTILQQLKINSIGRDRLAYMQALRTFVSDPASATRVILIFDEAQGLSDEVLEGIRLLSNFRPPERQAFQIILAGQPELARRLKEPKLRALNQRIGARALLRPLAAEEVRNYVNCLLEAQGARRELFSREALVELAALSGGVPRIINNICHNALLNSYLERAEVVQPQHVRIAYMEMENLLDSRERAGKAARHEILDWIPSQTRAAKAGGVIALAVLAIALVIEFGHSGNDSPRNYHESVVTSGSQSSYEIPNRESARQARNEGPAGTPAAANSIAPARIVKGASSRDAKAPLVADYARQAAVSAYTARPAASQASPGVPAIKSPAAASPVANTPRASVAGNPAVTAPVSGLTYQQRRRLAYEVKRATASFESGRYLNSIYHSRRALLIDPGNSEMRSILQRAQAAQSGSREASNDEDDAASVRAAPAAPVVHANSTIAPSSGSSNANSNDRNSTGAATTARTRTESFAEMARSEVSEGDASMRAGDYRKALVKFLTAATLDPNEDLSDRINRARQALGEPQGLHDDSDTGSSAADPGWDH
jgi:type II secretory pathway predicted ATPase ExeA